MHSWPLLHKDIILTEYVVREVRSGDLDALYHLAEASGIGFTSLPTSRKHLASKIDLSLESFAADKVDEQGEYYLFVLEHLPTGEVVGTSAIAAHVGMNELFYSYKVGKLTKQCEALGIRKEHQTLSVTTDLQGATEMCTLFLLPEHRGHKNGQLLARARYLYMAQNLERFSNPVIAELRGVSDENGYSPFWQAIGRHFYGVDFPEADYMTGKGNKQFIADLMPEFRIYTRMLPREAREAIGEVHEHTKPARALIEKEGFRYAEYVDMFDAGPTMKARLEDIKSINESEVLSINDLTPDEEGEQVIFANMKGEFRACIAYLEVTPDYTALESDASSILGDWFGEVRVLRLA